tara:strand:- start:944 stop:1462 length:519 start_codon:yes stop_codon:yes gene_type:complete
MTINKANLKKLLTPIIRECVREALNDKDLIQEIVLRSGVLSTVVKEVATGLTEASRSQIKFSNMLESSGPSESVVESRRLRTQTRTQVSTLPPRKAQPKPTTEFEKTHQSVDNDYAGKRNTYGALARSDPSDGGVSLAAFGLGEGNELNESRQPQTLSGVDISELTIGSRLK